MARSMARRIRSGTLVGPGTNRKLRPGIRHVLEREEKQSENRRLSLKLLGLTYSATPTPQPHGWVGLGPPKLRGDNSLPAHVAAGATGKALPEMCEERATPARAALDVTAHRRRVITPLEVGPPPQHHAVGRAPVPARAPRFLIVGLEAVRRPPVEHPAHVGLVDTHAERARGDDDRRAVGEEGAQHLTPSRRPEARVIRSRPPAPPPQGTCDQLGQAAGGCVHDRASVDAPEQLADAGKPLTVVPHLLYCEPEVRSIERRHNHLRVRHPQHPKDLGAGGGRGAPCERDCDWITEQIAMPVEPAIQGAEVIARLDDAVWFCHGCQRYLQSATSMSQLQA